jgi:hypothetical protein
MAFDDISKSPHNLNGSIGSIIAIFFIHKGVFAVWCDGVAGWLVASNASLDPLAAV